MQTWEQHILGPFSAAEVVDFRLAVEQAGREGYEIVGLTAASGWLYAAVKRPVVEAPQTVNQEPKARSRRRVQE